MPLEGGGGISPHRKNCHGMSRWIGRCVTPSWTLSTVGAKTKTTAHSVRKASAGLSTAGASRERQKASEYRDRNDETREEREGVEEEETVPLPLPLPLPRPVQPCGMSCLMSPPGVWYARWSGLAVWLSGGKSCGARSGATP